MSSSEANRSSSVRGAPRVGSSRLQRRAMMRLLVAGGLAMSLAGCEGGASFKPIYGSLGVDGQGVSQKLAQIEITTIPGRNGQRLRNELYFQLYGGGNPATPPGYTLSIAVRETGTTTLVTQNGNSAGQIYQMEAKFQLIRASDKKIVLEGLSHARPGYERFSNVFSNVRAADDAADRAAKTVANDLKIRLAAFLSQSS
jgi:LPS-assembly lipoprotein